MVELPDFGFGDLVAGMRNDGIGHINIGLIVADVLVSELILEYVEIGGEDVESAFSFMIHGQSEDHDP